MCSKLNEADAETCLFCGARLKPLRPDSGPISDRSTGGEPEGDEPAWLRDLRVGGPAPGEAADDAQPGQPDVPDWLSRIRERAREDTGAAPDLPRPEEEAQPDWMADLQAEASAPAEGGLDDGDWLERLSPGQETPAGPSAGGEENWMSKLSTWQSGSAEEPAPARDDLSGLGLTGFLNSLETGEAGRAAPEAEEQAPGLPAWDQPQDDQPRSGLPDWSQPEQTGDAGLPDWLSGPAPGEETPLGETPPGAAPDAEAFPGWLDGLAPGEPDPVQTGQPIPEEQDAALTDLPDWFTRFTGQDADATGETGQPTGAVEEPGLPEWLGGAGAVAAGALSELQAASGPTDEAHPEDAALPEPAAEAGLVDENTPDWLREFTAQPAEEGSALLPPVGEEEAIQAAGGEAEPAFAPGELPDWLSEEVGERSTEAPESSLEQPAAEALTQAELPDWVREMRPIESVNLGEPAAPETEQRVEQAGPLAGLRGILPADEMVTRYRKPPVYSARLRISEKQRSQASLLDSILEQETQPIMIPPARSHAPGMVGRILAALFWLVVLTIAFMVPLGLEPAPMRTPPELEDMFQHIDQAAQAERPVLLAVDFEPALAGEMGLAARPVVEHLMARNYPIVVLSTSPAGPALAQELLDGAVTGLAGQSPGYDLAARTVNLGYLPGGVISLLEFAQFPRQAAPASILGDYGVWNQPILQQVAGLRDFGQVIVITDSAEVGRAWVEQVQPQMGETPLFIVSSVQAEPMLMPYVDSGQIAGLTGGLLGGVLYSQWRQVEPAAGPYWPAYQVGTWLAFVVLLVGGLVSGGAALARRGKDGA
jgi:hypothetical protein